ncbi:hypothetical protein BRARA_J02296 [Brassica rapa]|uniref:Uncharacterized protein n=1 Tax=Brassica campestris TaxID=3711 RepID=A0A397XX67_BRACM|nr:hypothetical protein BRARA_J02296 [Brassica rapa]
MGLSDCEILVVVLDERGCDVDSEQIAEEVRKRANVINRLSSMVLDHQIALVVLLMEQLYRAWTILKGQSYHH